LGTAEVQTFIDTARKFARREVAPMVGTEGRDGELSRLAEILKSASNIGLLATPDPQSPGHEYGVWGRASLNEGPAASVAILQEVAAACPGVAACFHFSGLSALELEGSSLTSQTCAVALFEDSWRLNKEVIKTPPAEALKITAENNRIILAGEKSLVPSAPDCRGYVVYGAGKSGWSRVFVPADAPGLEIEDPGQRTGLAALKIASLNFEKVSVDQDQELPARDLSSFLRRLFLGIAAIAAGNARAAVDEAAAYARERYQGRTKIINHPAIKILLGDAASRVSASEAHLKSAADRDCNDLESFFRAASAKLRITLDCCQAVTDSVQALGGYGYMEDYRLEKRLRDALTLKVMAGRPDDLRMLIAAKPEAGS
jgi:alkylation response protein AidB-like acyl-CoA dehydrogenase